MRKIHPKKKAPAPKKPLKYLRGDLQKIREKLSGNKDQQSLDVLAKCNTWLTHTSKSHHKQMRTLGNDHPQVRALIEEIKQEGAEILLEYKLGPGFED